MEFNIRYFLAVFIPPASVLGLGRRTLTAAPIGVFFIAAIGTWVVAPWTAWFFLGNILWAASEVWAVLTVRGAEEDARHEPESTSQHQVDPDRHFPGEDQAPRDE